MERDLEYQKRRKALRLLEFQGVIPAALLEPAELIQRQLLELWLTTFFLLLGKR
ncbi:MAG: hypothetical protein ACREBG_23180 [Pyrinomonadaceae bacterium]